MAESGLRLLFLALGWAPRGAALGYARYVRSEAFLGQDFFEPFRWSFHTAEDPTHGTVDYVNYSVATLSGLVNATTERVYMGADSKTVIQRPSRSSAAAGAARGRRSVRIMSRRAYNGGLFVIKLDHMPTGCGVWPAFWMYGEDPQHIWPSWGEFDIIEGVHRGNRTMTTLHTTGGCDQSTVQRGKEFTGKWLRGLDRKADNCDVSAKGQWGNQGCSQAGPEASMGKAFNDRGGGTFAAEWDPEGGHFRTWFWPISEGIPADLDMMMPDPDSWGRPYSYFELSEEDCSQGHFKDMRIVFDITFCGDLGAPTFAQGCPEVAKRMTCQEFVENHPENFTEAFWSIRKLDVYQAVLQTTTPSPTTSPGEASMPQPESEGQAPQESVDALAQAVKKAEAVLEQQAAAKAAAREQDPWAPPVPPELFHSEAAARAQAVEDMADSPRNSEEEFAASRGEGWLRVTPASPTTTPVPWNEEPRYAPKYIPKYMTSVVMKAAGGRPRDLWDQLPRPAGWLLAAAGASLLVAGGLLVVGLPRRFLPRCASRLGRVSAGSLNWRDKQPRYQELAAPRGCALLPREDVEEASL